MDELNEKIRALSRKRNEFFLLHPEATRAAFLREIKHDCQKRFPIAPGQAALTAFLTGRILGLSPEFDQNAVDSLNKSLRLDVNNAAAWIELGKCAWKKPDLEQALSSFKQAVEIKADSRSLSFYSAVLRSQASRSADIKQKLLLIRECVEMCKKAVDEDPTYPFAWYSLANTYLLRFFATAQLDPRDLDHAAEAYERALSQERPFVNADCHINYHEVLLYQQKYRLALEHAQQAVRIEPHFESALDRLDAFQTFLLSLERGDQKKRKIKDLISSLNSAQSAEGTKTLDELQVGANPEVTIAVKVVSVVSHNNQVPFTAIVLDRNSNCFGVTIFNFSSALNLLVGDTLRIPAPLVLHVNDDPSLLERNEKPLGRQVRALTDASFRFQEK
ncbi:Tetratricopeptide repeat protein [Aphelenchoides fujianensis]|nr:Tetratricopeptide repeat protein [Aphelenchoides fujianensis]